MTVYEAASSLFSYFSPEEREIPDNPTYPGRNGAVRDALNSALQEMFGSGKPWARKDNRGLAIKAPTTVLINVSQNSKSCTIIGLQPWHDGCRIVIAGDETVNRIRTSIGTASELKFPYTATTGLKQATIWMDSLTIDADVIEILSPVKLNGVPLNPVIDPSAQSLPPRVRDDYGRRDGIVRATSEASEAPGIPRRYRTDTWTAGGMAASSIRMRLSPAPAQGGVLDYECYLTAPRVTDLDSPIVLPIPFGLTESVFLAIAKMRLMESPFFRTSAVPQAIQDSYRSAMATIKASNPNKTAGPRIISIG